MTNRRGRDGAAETFARKRGVARDLTHMFIGAARRLGIPARYIAGYLCSDSAERKDGGHAWAEAFVPGLGWVGFDAVKLRLPNRGLCARRHRA